MLGTQAGLLTGFVLAGGRSSRMGRDKAGLVWEGKSLLIRAVHVMRLVAGSVVVVGNPLVHQVDRVPVISDRIEGAGPLGGLEAALRASSTDWNVILACDMPGMNERVLRAVVQRAFDGPECDAVIPVSGGVPQPLCGAYHRRVLPALEAALGSGTFKMMEALRPVRVCRLEMGPAEAFRNVNTPEEWDTLITEKST